MKTTHLVLILAAATVAVAQRPGWDAQGHFGGFHGGPVVTNEPYSGVGVATSTRTLADGNVINSQDCTKVYRDSAGRTRREETPKSTTCSTTPQSIVITDPVAGVEYFINGQNNTYRQITLKAPPAGATPPQGAGHQHPNNPNAVVTSLGTQAIAGTSLSAQGTQTVTTIPAGQFGNAQPITITSVRWFSPDLKVVIQSSHTDPRNGTANYQLSNVSTAEPAASLFQLPAGLTLQQGPGGGQQGRGRRGR